MDQEAMDGDTRLVPVPAKFEPLVRRYLQQLQIQEAVGCLKLQAELQPTTDLPDACVCDNLECELVDGEVETHPNYAQLFSGLPDDLDLLDDPDDLAAPDAETEP